jgi:hypothetical protein
MSARLNGHHLHPKNSENDPFLKYRDEAVFNNKKSILECMKLFDKDNDDSLDLGEFESLTRSLFCFNGNPYEMPKAQIKEMFNYFDNNKVRI